MGTRVDTSNDNRLVFAITLFLVAIPCHAQTPSHAIPFEGKPFPAEFAGFDPQQNIKLKIGNKLRIMPAADLIRWGSWQDVDAGPQLLLASGGVLRADVLSLNETNLILGDASGLGSVLWAESAIPVEAIGGIVWQPPADPLARDRLRARLLSLPVGNDQVLLVGGESLSGTLVSVPPAGRFAEKLTRQELAAADVFTLQMPKADKPVVIPASKVLAIRCGAAEFVKTELEKKPTTFTRIGFREGSWLLAAKVETGRETFALQLPGGGKLVANAAFGDGSADWFWQQACWLQPVSDRVVYVSDLTPVGYKHLPFLSGQWNFGRDENVLGGQLRTRDEVVPKGLGMFPASRLAYTLDGKYRQLQGEWTLDAQAGKKGSVTFRVLLESAAGEWTTAIESATIRGGEPSVDFSIDVKNAQRLAILVDFADQGDQCDYANWLNLRLLK